jgi:hypothetical protein
LLIFSLLIFLMFTFLFVGISVFWHSLYPDFFVYYYSVCWYFFLKIFACWHICMFTIFFWIFVLVSWHAFISSLVMMLDFLANRPLTPPSPLQDYSTCNSPRLLFHNF